MAELAELLPRVRYLSFAGAAARGMAYIGVVRALQAHGGLTALRGCVGVSSGALVALTVCINLSDEAIGVLIAEHDGVSVFGRGDMTRLLHTYGLDDGALLRALVHRVLELGGMSPTITFGNLRRLTGRDFACVTTSLSSGAERTWSADSAPDARVADAVVASMSLPFIFTPVELEGELHVDGGVAMQLAHAHFPLDETLLCSTWMPWRPELATWDGYARTVLRANINSHVQLIARTLRAEGRESHLLLVRDGEGELLKFDSRLVARGYSLALCALRPELPLAVARLVLGVAAMRRVEGHHHGAPFSAVALSTEAAPPPPATAAAAGAVPAAGAA